MFYIYREETFQREIMCGLLNAQEGDYLLWNIERTITKIYIPVLLDSCMGDKGTKDLLTKVRESYQIEWFKSKRLTHLDSQTLFVLDSYDKYD